MKLSKVILGLFCLSVLLLLPGVGEAFGYEVTGKNIYGRKSPDGAISFFVTDSRSNWVSDASSRWSLHKVYPVNGGSPFYYIYVDVVDNAVKKNPVDSVRVSINGKAWEGEPFPELATVAANKNFRGWYSLAPDIDTSLRSLETMEVQLVAGEKVLKAIKTADQTHAALRQLPAMQAVDYVREGKVADTPEEAVKRVVQPQVFIPHATVEDIQAALIYKTTIITRKDKDEFLYYKGYRIWRDKNSQFMALEGFESVDGDSTFATIAARPFQDGVWVSMSLMRQWYLSNSLRYRDYDEGNYGFINMRGYWRSKADEWANLLADIHHEFCGRYDYGIAWQQEERQKDNAAENRFRIQSVDAAAFPTLQDVKSGDLLIAVNGVKTGLMRPVDLRYWLDANGQSVVLTISNDRNEVKDIAVSPRLLPAPPLAKNYKAAIGIVSKKFIREGKLEFADEPAFYPLESAGFAVE
jgi:hypothetical protein